MPIRLHNTYSREVEEFVPIDPEGKVVKMYTCGPTVYDHAHIGNLRAYIFEDLLQRHLEMRGYEVQRVMNLTDVDDKTIRNAAEAGVPLGEFTQQYKDAFFKDLEALNIKRADHFPAATDDENIARMIEMIEQLVAGDFAYQAEDKSVYFRIAAFPDYGKLAHLNLEELRPSGRIQNDEYEKEAIGDFALWKAWTEADGEVGWDSPWGKGRPGWHIECSAMAARLLGDEIDIHCGGVDNIFPHHEAEIAQSHCCKPGTQFVRYWIHNQHLRVDGGKMSKSEGNFYTLRDLLDAGWSGREVRHMLISVRYDQPLNFVVRDRQGNVTWESLAASRKALARIDEWVARLEKQAGGATGGKAIPLVEDCGFLEALDDNLNIAGALGHLFDVIRETNKLIDRGEIGPAEARGVLDWWHGEADAVLALGAAESAADDAIPAEIQAMLDQRATARADRDFAESDRLRDAIAAAGWTVIDGKDGQELKAN